MIFLRLGSNRSKNPQYHVKGESLTSILHFFQSNRIRLALKADFCPFRTTVRRVIRHGTRLARRRETRAVNQAEEALQGELQRKPERFFI